MRRSVESPNLQKIHLKYSGIDILQEESLEKVLSALKHWEEKELVAKAVKEIVEVHKRHEKFSAKTHTEAEEYVEREFRK